MTTVEEIINLRDDGTTSLSRAKKLELKSLGRDRPIFTFEGKRKCNLVHQYQRYEWLTGCPVRKALFCFPCLIFKFHTTVLSSDAGLTDLSNFSNHVKRHTKSPTHLAAATSLKLLGRIRADEMLSEDAKTVRNMYNEEVRKNREMLRHHIRATVFLVCQGLPFNSHSDSTDSSSHGNFVELVKLLGEFSSDPLIRNAISPGQTLAFTGLSPDIQDDLIKCLYDHIRGEIVKRIKSAPFISVITDDTTDISNTGHMAISVRLVSNGSVFEHLIDLVDVSADRSAATLAGVICQSLESVGVTQSTAVIGQSYDGSNNMMGKNNSVQTKIQEKWPTATFVHCYAHEWAEVVENVSKTIPTVSLFFGILLNLTKFLRTLSERTSMTSSSSPLASVWLAKGKSISAISSNYLEICCLLDTIASDCSTDSQTRAEAKGLHFQLGSRENVFLLFFFRQVLALSDDMIENLPRVETDPTGILSKVADYRKNLSELRSESSLLAFIDETKRYEDFFYMKATDTHIKKECLEDIGATPSKSSALIENNPPTNIIENDKLKSLMYEIIDKLTSQLDLRFENIERFQWMKLFQPSKFDVLKVDAFEVVRLVNELQKYHPDFVPDKENFRNELHILYTDPDLRLTLGPINDPSTLLKKMHYLDLYDALPMISKALVASQTFALTSVTSERTFSVLRRIQTDSLSTMTQERMKELVLLSLETSLLRQLSTDCSFLDSIIDAFASMKERKIHLLYRK